ncbi:DUF397 domain-containing protein [Micromonospora sp. LOL_015]|uniref:DUF397 domain-containing protein n=1 Tax=Micromonospora sp. LOL_015 TaxID=3345416 RepID=UPI003A8BB4F2
MSTARYRKSTRSDSTGSCVEVATNVPATVLVRDSKDPASPALSSNPAGWTSFLTTLNPLAPQCPEAPRCPIPTGADDAGRDMPQVHI